MSFLHHGRKYKPGHKWQKSQLLALTPEKLLKYIKLKVYGDEKADPQEDPPVHYRRNAVLYWKKGLVQLYVGPGPPVVRGYSER